MNYNMLDYKDFKASIEQFCYKVFNYYNGRINMFNYPAILRIEWATLNSKTYSGVTTNPNIVTIYPNIISRYAPCVGPNTEFNIYYMVLETIIHELYHIDQIIDFPRTIVDAQYNEYIENAVEVQTAIYIANHTQEIMEQFGIMIEPRDGNFQSMILKYETGAHYHRKKYADHIFMLVKELLCGVDGSVLNDISIIIRSNIADRAGSMIITTNTGKSFTIQNNDFIADVESVNRFLWDNYYQYSYKLGEIGADYDKANRVLIICINTDNRNTMVKLAGR